MNAPGNPLPPLKLLAARSKDARLTILLTGSTTVYTSSMTNPLSNTRIMQVDTGKNGILEIIMWDRLINDLPCRIITLPGLAHMSRDIPLTQTSIEAIRASIAPVHCIWFTARLNETLLNQDEQNVINQITTILGEQAWNYAILVLTHSNAIKDTWKQADMMKKRSENIRAEISLHTGWDIAANITSVPVTALDDIMLAGKEWLPEFYERILSHSNLRGKTMSASAVPPAENGLSLQTNYQGQEATRSQEALLASTSSHCWFILTCWYLSSALVGAIGMSLAGPQGFIIGLAGNLVFWMLLKWLKIFQSS